MLKPNFYLNWHIQKVGNVSWVLTQWPALVGLAKGPKFISIFLEIYYLRTFFCPSDQGWTPRKNGQNKGDTFDFPPCSE